MQKLDLNNTSAPALCDVFDPAEIALAMTRRHLFKLISPDNATQMYVVEKGAPRTKLTMNIDGLVVRDGLVLARHMRQFLPSDTAEFPETKWENMISQGMKATLWVDGYPAVLYQSTTGNPMIALRGAFTQQPVLWACTEYREKFKKASWPPGFTPNFVLVHPDHTKTIEYLYRQILLIALVNTATGEELPYDAVCAWGQQNEMLVVPEKKISLHDIPGRMLEQKGLVLRWDDSARVTVPLRVGVYARKFQNAQGIVEQVTPVGLWELLSEDADLSPLYDKRTMPEGFVSWVKMWEGILNGTYAAKEQEVVDFWNAAKLPAEAPYNEIVQGVATEFWRQQTVGKEWALPILLKMLADEPATALLWAAVKEVTDGQKCWTRS